MGVVIIRDNLTKEDFEKAKVHYKSYIKITIDIVQKIVALGGEYHADAEAELVKLYRSKHGDIWGGGYNFKKKVFETNAIVNIKPNHGNHSLEITDSNTKDEFLNLAKKMLNNIESFI